MDEDDAPEEEYESKETTADRVLLSRTTPRVPATRFHLSEPVLKDALGCCALTREDLIPKEVVLGEKVTWRRSRRIAVAVGSAPDIDRGRRCRRN